jgi:hypothetical protein
VGRQCQTLKIGDTVAIVCGDPPRVRKCQFCRQRPGANQCDFLIGGKCRKCKGHGERSMNTVEHRMHQAFIEARENPVAGFSSEEAEEGLINLTASLVCHDCAGKGAAMCNRYFCGTECGIRLSEKEGYCPTHQAAAGHPKKLKREHCVWVTANGEPKKCLRKGCETIVRPGESCLYFPERYRGMDERCGLEYLRLSA